jgi:hypothetical protein
MSLPICGSPKQCIANLRVALTGFLVVLMILASASVVNANELSDRSLKILNDVPNTTTDYEGSFITSSSASVGSIKILFCKNSPLQQDICVAPAGFDVTNAQLISTSGISGFSLFVAGTNELILSRTASFVSAGQPFTFTIGNIVNPSASGAYYARIATYSSHDGSGSSIDFGGMALSITGSLELTAVVPPYLIFCVGLIIPGYNCAAASGDYINFGNFSSSITAQADSQILAASNAADGYAIEDYGTTMTSGNNVIPAMTDDETSQINTSQFGINLRANSSPAGGADPSGPGNGSPTPSYDNPDHYQFVDNDIIVSTSAPDNLRKYTVSYIVNVNASQPPGIYVSTLTYVCTGSF